MNPCAKDLNRKLFARQVSMSQAPSLMIVTIGMCGEHVETLLTTGQNEHDTSPCWPVHAIFEHDWTISRTNNDWYRYKLQSSLTPLPSHNKREQYLGNQITRFRNAPWQCGGKKKKLPWRQIAPFPLDLFISPPFSPFFSYNSTFYFLIFFYYYPVLLLNPLLYIQLVSLLSPTWPLANHGPRSSQNEHPPLQSTNCHSLLASRILRDPSFDLEQLVPEKRQ